MIEGVNEKKLLDEIALAGYKRPTLYTLHYAKKPLPKDIVTLILKWLPKIYEEDIGSGEFLVRALVYTEQPYSPAVLLDLFEKSNLNDTLKQSLAHVLSISNLDTDISDYIKKQLLNKPASFSRVGFLSAIEVNARFKSGDELVSFLKKIFREYSYYETVFKLFRKYGIKEDVSFLENELPFLDKKKSKEVDKIINYIQKRKKDPIFPKKKLS